MYPCTEVGGSAPLATISGLAVSLPRQPLALWAPPYPSRPPSSPPLSPLLLLVAQAPHYHYPGHLSLPKLGFAVHKQPGAAGRVVDRDSLEDLLRNWVREMLLQPELELWGLFWVVQFSVLVQGIGVSPALKS